jgi:hypothetical protein
VKSEADLHPVREAFTELAKKLRAKTGLALEYALSCTVAERNIEEVPEIIRWYLADPERTLIWRMISFQPEADTGRTIFSKHRVTPERVWEKMCEATGLPLRRDASIFGHPDCNSWASLLVARPSGRFCALLPDDKKWDPFFGKVSAQIGGLSLVTDDARTAPWKIAGVLAQHPFLLAQLLYHLVRHLILRRMPWEIFRSLLRGQVHTLGVGMHNFMDASQVARADEDATVRSRLDSCVFKGAVKRDGEWVAVPMCSMNQRAWSEVYEERLRDPALRPEPELAER